ncbi:uncharacterized protein HKW66_Vig0102220 [Vigna angularis]|uniref:Uncharacterized protein n=1 Tax=Phaseolus angularis TaxID=3914 RepID=A0A8T0KJR5_PHAAN|nr:uncharacterized protein LOC108331254 [Vigna angularis]KAG2399924.1 uncharacterized protein HKW66_Vig0102220 [Vigna angularis]
MEGEFEPTTLHMFIDCYHETFLPTFLHSQTAFQTIEDTITELAAVSTSLKCLFLQVAIMQAAELVVEIMDPPPSSYEGSSTAAPLTFVPNALPQFPPNSSVLNATQSNSAVGARTGKSERPSSQNWKDEIAPRFKVSSETGKRGSTSTSQRTQRTTNNVVIRDSSVVLPNPHLRLFETTTRELMWV